MRGLAWEEFCDRLKAAGQVVLRDDVPGSELDRAEGYRHLIRLLTSATENFIEDADPDFPYFQRVLDITKKSGMDNADNIYLRAPLRGDATYRITGKRGTVKRLQFQIISGYHGWGECRNIASLNSEDMIVKPDGTFEIVLSADSHGGNWLVLQPDVRFIEVRQTFYDWDNEMPAEMRIIQLAKEGASPVPLEPAQLAHQLDMAIGFFTHQVSYWPDYMRGLQQRLPPNVVGLPRGADGQASADTFYAAAHFDLKDNEALVVAVAPSDAVYWGCQLGNFWWESLDYANRHTSLTGHQSQLGSDNIYRFVVAHHDPGVPNWLDTAGHRKGVLLFRWTLFRDQPPKTPQTKVLPFDRIRDEFPQDCPSIDEAARKESVSRRQAHVSRRFNQ